MNNIEDTDERLAPGFVPAFVRSAFSTWRRGEQWLAELPGVIAQLERAWPISVGQALAGGTGWFVAPARTAEGGDAILKIATPRGASPTSCACSNTAQGYGYVRRRAGDREREAMLLEALGPPMASLGLPPEQRIALLGQMLRQAWHGGRPADLVVTPDDEKAGQLFRLVSRLWEELGHPCSQRVVTEVLRYAERRAAAFDLGDGVLPVAPYRALVERSHKAERYSAGDGVLQNTSEIIDDLAGLSRGQGVYTRHE